MRRLLLSAASILAGFGLTVAALEIRPGSGESPGQRLGSLDFDRYCVTRYGSSAAAISTTADAFGWRCASRENGLFATFPVDVSAACAELFGAPAYAETSNPGWLYSWECYRGPKPTA